MKKESKKGVTRKAPFTLGFTGRGTSRPGGPSRVCSKVSGKKKGK